MNNKHFIITGTSKGIGEQLAKMLLENGSYVYGISRGISDNLAECTNYIHFNFDLSNILEIERLLNEILDQIDINTSEMICLINNAAMLEPLKSIEQCSAEEINKNLQLKLE